MKFDTIKKNAKAIYAGSMSATAQDATVATGTLAKGSEASFAAVLPFILTTANEREEMREFADKFEAQDGDTLAAIAKSEGKDSAWSQVVLKARETGLELIEKWDIRQVSKLIELFPESVPAKYRNTQLSCFMADNANSDWMIKVAA